MAFPIYATRRKVKLAFSATAQYCETMYLVQGNLNKMPTSIIVAFCKAADCSIH